jgi:uncharacterized membrane protein YtjA (UPF0391 family)
MIAGILGLRVVADDAALVPKVLFVAFLIHFAAAFLVGRRT